MEPITETIRIALEFSQTASISISTVTVSTNTYQTEGTIYIPYPYSIFDPISILASFIMFVLIGVTMRKPTTFIIAWIGFTITGIFNQGGIYWTYVNIIMIALMVMYHVFRTVTGTSEESTVNVEVN